MGLLSLNPGLAVPFIPKEVPGHIGLAIRQRDRLNNLLAVTHASDKEGCVIPAAK
jgi:hypothetical protein